MDALVADAVGVNIIMVAGMDALVADAVGVNVIMVAGLGCMGCGCGWGEWRLG